ncbi:MAG: hypothetical protein V2I38_07555 [Alcanivoracaceae bacterium]|jgi:hypothetical protein|nr:hypothetical protein [Alcanivoracaceae bacterium]
MKDQAEILQRITSALSSGRRDSASCIAAAEYPFTPSGNAGRSYTQLQALEIFIRDGFIDRYTGKRLVYPSVLYALANELPDRFPIGGGRSKSHSAHWDLFPTIDHLEPVSRGGKDDASNWVTTSMTMNMAKTSSTLEELSWRLHPEGSFDQWDGLCSWYRNYIVDHPYLATAPFNKGWHTAFVRGFS